METLEDRRLLSAAGLPSVAVGGTYTLNLAHAGTVTGYSVNWGDGNTTPLSGSATTATHAYASAGTFAPTATASYSAGPASTDALGPDTTFATAGKLTTPFASVQDVANGTTVQPDGKLIVVGQTSASGNFKITRYNTDGSLDTTFGTGGIVDTGYAVGNARDLSVVMNADKITVTGLYSGYNSGYTALAVTRYNADGSLDASFGDLGVVVTPFTANQDSSGLSTQSDGSTIVGGAAVVNGTSSYFAFSRYDFGGNLDTSFGANGVVTTPFNSYFPFDATAQGDGKVLVAGWQFGNTGYVFQVARYNTDGSLDTTFGTDGFLSTGYATINNLANTLAIGPDGKIVTGGGVSVSGVNKFALNRYNPDGTPDTTFGDYGQVTTTVNADDDWTNNLVVQDDGKIVVAGKSQSGSGYYDVARYNTDGSLDSTFGNGGTLATTLKGADVSGDYYSEGNGNANALALGPNGLLYLIGKSGGGNVAVERLLPTNTVNVETAPNAPTQVDARATSGNSVLVDWVNDGTADTYAVQASTDGVNFTTVATAAGTTQGIVVKGLSLSTGYTFQVVARNAAGNATSGTASTTTLATDTTGYYQVSSPTADPNTSLLAVQDDGSPYVATSENLRLQRGRGLILAASQEDAILQSVTGDEYNQTTGDRYTPTSGAFDYVPDYVDQNGGDQGPSLGINDGWHRSSNDSSPGSGRNDGFFPVMAGKVNGMTATPATPQVTANPTTGKTAQDIDVSVEITSNDGQGINPTLSGGGLNGDIANSWTRRSEANNNAATKVTFVITVPANTPKGNYGFKVTDVGGSHASGGFIIQVK